MPQLIERARQVAAPFYGHAGASLTPDPPQNSMFHLRLEGEKDELLEAHDRVAREMGICLFGNLKAANFQSYGTHCLYGGFWATRRLALTSDWSGLPTGSF